MLCQQTSVVKLLLLCLFAFSKQCIAKREKRLAEEDDDNNSSPNNHYRTLSRERNADGIATATKHEDCPQRPGFELCARTRDDGARRNGDCAEKGSASDGDRPGHEDCDGALRDCEEGPRE